MTAYLVAVVLGLYVSQQVAAESGEVVVLTTQNQSEEAQETRLWVVDFEGRQWLRSGSDIQSWYGNIRRLPEVEVERGAIAKRYLAVPSPENQAVIGRLMAEKYGWADRYIGFLFGRDKSIPIRLDPQ